VAEISGVGIDLVEVSRIYRVCRSRREKFLQRVFTEREQTNLSSREGTPHPRIAACFAAKEAVLKALECGIGPARLREVEVITEKGKPPRVKLHGKARQIAGEAGVKQVLLSISHEKTVAAAQAIALGAYPGGEAVSLL